MYLYLDVFEDFVCEMCGTCCRNDWVITVDQESYLRNEKWFTERGGSEEFHQAFVPLAKPGLGEYAAIAKHSSGVCCFLEPSNLCRLHREAGHDHLDGVCKTFPRYPMNTSRGVELTLSLLCPAAFKKLLRVEPLVIVRNNRPPCQQPLTDYAVEAFPEQQSRYQLLHYYFELETHFIDIMQCRSMSLEERLEFLAAAIQRILNIPCDEEIGRSLHCALTENYLRMDETSSFSPVGHCTPEIVLEHFFVNFIFKKPFYIYGLQKTMRLLQSIWQKIRAARQTAATTADDMEITGKLIVDIELQYNHNHSRFLELFEAGGEK